MSVTTTPTKPLIISGLIAAAVAAAATTAVAALGQVAGISLDVAGMPIPLAGFAVLTAIFSLVGLGLALALARWTRHPRTVFLRTTIALTVLSLIPDVFADASTATKLLLVLTHVVAAAIVIPAIARRLPA